MGPVSMKFLILLSLFIIIVIISIGYSLINRNNKGRLMALGVSILLLIISSTTMYKNEKSKNLSYSYMAINYDELLKELDITYRPASELKENEKFKKEARVLFNRASIFLVSPDEITNLFSSKEMAESFKDLIKSINLIGLNLLDEDYLIESVNIESMTNYLRQIGSMLDSPNKSSSYIRKGNRVKVDYNDKEINKIKSLLADMDKALVKEIDRSKDSSLVSE